MILTDEQIQEDDERWKDRDLIEELKYCGNKVKRVHSVTMDDQRFDAYLMRRALKEIESRSESTDEPAEIDFVNWHGWFWYCSKCQERIQKYSRYCSWCGTKLLDWKMCWERRNENTKRNTLQRHEVQD